MEKEISIKTNKDNNLKFTDTIEKNTNTSLGESVGDEGELEYFTE